LFKKISGLLQQGRSPSLIDGQEAIFALDKETPKKDYPTAVESVCPVCGAAGPFAVPWKDTATGWMRARCPECSMVSVQPVPSADEIKNLYESEGRKQLSVIRVYRQSALSGLSISEEELKKFPAYLEIAEWDDDFDWDAFEAGIPGTKRLLDIGCSAGRILATFQRLGWETVGIDPDPDSVAYAREHGLNARVGMLDDLSEADGLFHVISFIDVIEHVPDPKAAVQKIHSLLNHQGLLYVKTPMCDSLPHRLIGDRWLESVEHLQFFNRATLKRLLEDCGFEVVAFRQPRQHETPIVFYKQWQEKILPEALHGWMETLTMGDTSRLLARKK
jgi:2-polyprenyl-3-methyl-5-hydroxy-6-metoxy-1,4-benzoquinol methylase